MCISFARDSFVAFLAAVTVATGTLPASASPISRPAFKNGDPIPGRYVVVFKESASEKDKKDTKDKVKQQGGTVDFEYDAAIKGFAGSMSDADAEDLKKDKGVDYVEPDFAIVLEPVVDAEAIGAVAVQSPATWGLDRIDQRNLPLNNTYSYNYTGAGVRVYIIDTGIRASHLEFGGRAVAGFSAINDGNGTNDCNGHGTHVAGTVGGATYGVAKGVTLVAVRVLNCNGSGTTSGVIAGVDWVTQNAANGNKPAVANMSLGGSASRSLDAAVSNSINSGVTYAVAAGNSNANACNYSPAGVSAAITVGATTSSDARASYSNYGNCLDLFAPGSSVTSAWYMSDGALNTISGTSMATPHVAGAAALYLQSNPAALPDAVRNAIVAGATTNVVSNAGKRSPNVLLFVLP
jgi:subtilisin family serine protease